MDQIARLDILAEWLKGEVEKADLTDMDTLRALRRIIEPLADALNIDTRPRDPGPPEEWTEPVGVNMCHDPLLDRYWGHCDDCGIVTPLWESANVVCEALGFHMAEEHPSRECAMTESEVEL